MENFLEPIELNDAELTAVAGGFLDFDFDGSTGATLNNSVNFANSSNFSNSGNMTNTSNGSSGGISLG